MDAPNAVVECPTCKARSEPGEPYLTHRVGCRNTPDRRNYKELVLVSGSGVKAYQPASAS